MVTAVDASRRNAAERVTPGRARGSLDVREGTRRRVYQQAPLRALWPASEPGQPEVLVVANTSGGVLGGDQLSTSIHVDSGHALTVTGQAAEKLYRSSGEMARIDVRVTVERGASAELLPRGTIVFNANRLRRRTLIDVARGGTCLAGEILVLGRVARGERWTTGSIEDRWEVRTGGRLGWFDTLLLDGDDPERLARALHFPAALGGARAIATIVAVSDDAPRHLEAARGALAAALEGVDGVDGGVTALPGLLIARLLGPEPAEVRAAWAPLWGALRHELGGWPTELPRPALV
jgi:urease accessory protein